MTHPLPGAEPCCGFLNVLKPPGMTSSQVVGRVRRLLGGAKVGHAGTLDPEAAGVLPLMVGKAARLFDYLQDKEKAYVAEVAFGTETDTQDAQGAVACNARGTGNSGFDNRIGRPIRRHTTPVWRRTPGAPIIMVVCTDRTTFCCQSATFDGPAAGPMSAP